MISTSDISSQPMTAEPDDAEELFWLPAEARPATAGPLTDERFIL
ncbi:hypothetical protein [Dactylosporangium sp. CA-139066]